MSGIEAEIFDGIHANMMWLHTNAIGGIKLKVRRMDSERARELRSRGLGVKAPSGGIKAALRKGIVRGAFVLGLGAAGLLALGYSLCRPANRPVPDTAAAGIQRIEIGDGTGWTTVAWALKGENGKGIVLAHGNSSNRNSMLPRMRYFHSLGYSVIAPDLRAHGETQGRGKTFGMLESKDVAKAGRYLRETFGAGRVAALGASLGGAAILKSEADGAGWDAIIIESVFRDIRTAARNRLEMRMGKAGIPLEPLLTLQTPLWTGFARDEISPIRWAGRCRAPLLVLAGDADPRAKPEESRDLFSAAPSPFKKMRIFEGAEHQDLFAFDRSGYAVEAARFLEEALGAGGGTGTARTPGAK